MLGILLLCFPGACIRLFFIGRSARRKKRLKGNERSLTKLSVVGDAVLMLLGMIEIEALMGLVIMRFKQTLLRVSLELFPPL
jgi:hypothetical protein